MTVQEAAPHWTSRQAIPSGHSPGRALSNNGVPSEEWRAKVARALCQNIETGPPQNWLTGIGVVHRLVAASGKGGENFDPRAEAEHPDF